MVTLGDHQTSHFDVKGAQDNADICATMSIPASTWYDVAIPN
jgi:hypothetical protein